MGWQLVASPAPLTHPMHRLIGIAPAAGFLVAPAAARESTTSHSPQRQPDRPGAGSRKSLCLRRLFTG